ncbi:MAG: energy-coupling factor transporter transmembrane component T family protein [Candidatus Heimdallarchaeaceae archaeon]
MAERAFLSFNFNSIFYNGNHARVCSKFEKYFFPNIIVTIILLILRYTPLLYEEGKEIRVSQELRGLDFASWKERIKAFGALLGGTLIRSVKKGGDIYKAMVLRGMENSKIVQRGKVKWSDPIILLVLTAVLSLLSGGIINCIMK